ncbi:AMP-binding protein [Myxococcus landrumensis]|uniref:AMP-binding protein n=1 Tax=Myxococcus landrumensis TaxID=2813577 RepID=A0ABX7NCI7_9BACT|nr:AMP-binding protein [Myxococcus landrumus]
MKPSPIPRWTPAPNQLAHYLRSLGVLPGSRVALRLDRSPDLIVALLAILKAGAAYVPLDKAWPSERLSFVLRESFRWRPRLTLRRR